MLHQIQHLELLTWSSDLNILHALWLDIEFELGEGWSQNVPIQAFEDAYKLYGTVFL